MITQPAPLPSARTRIIRERQMLPLTRLFSELMVTNVLTRNLPLKGTPDAPTPERQIAMPERQKPGNRDARNEKTGNHDERNEKKREIATPELRKM